jgi:hypothetical protein
MTSDASAATGLNPSVSVGGVYVDGLSNIGGPVATNSFDEADLKNRLIRQATDE